jgi:hypothetical protein
VQARLDAFLASASPTLQTPAGDVTVRIPFRLPAPASTPVAGSAERTAIEAAATALGMNAMGLRTVLLGRGTPAQIHDLAQELIAMGGLPNDSRPVDVRIREMMERHGLGLDPTAYVRQAFLAATGLTSRQAHFSIPLAENLSGLQGRGFVRVSVASARPGDIVALGPGPGGARFHAIVYGVRKADSWALDEFARSIGAVPGMPPCSGHLTVMDVDSTFGPVGLCDEPGPARVTLYHDEVTNVWVAPRQPTHSGMCVMLNPPGKQALAAMFARDATRGMPLRRPLEGVFRFAGH